MSAIPSPRAAAGPVTLWRDTARAESPAHDPLPGPCAVDIASVGGGYTGLWTAYYLAKGDPTLRIMVLEMEFVAFGASGRNGGWASAIFPATRRELAALSDRDCAIPMQRAMKDTVVEVGRAAAAEGIECGFQQNGYVVQR